MRDHATIVRAYGAQALGRFLEQQGFNVSSSTPQRWADRNSIPGEYWAAIADAKIASLEELAAAAANRRATPEPTPAEAKAA